MHRKNGLCALLLAVALLLCACGSVPTVTTGTALEAQGENPVPLAFLFRSSADSPSYQAPDFADSQFHSELAEGNDQVKLDLSAVNQGYVAVSAQSDKRLKFQVILGEAVYNYDIASDGTPSILPLQSGNGSYRFRVMENVVDSKYAELYSAECAVTLADDFQPFLRPSDYINYSQDSDCVRKSAELAAGAEDELAVVSAVYDYICDTVTYDVEKAGSVRSGYLPDTDETMHSGKGICFDYAALAASMLRSQGIPTKMIFGYVSPEGLYHAWNMFYTAQTGWVTVSFEVQKDSWNRLDLTFAANGADSSFIGNGDNYADIYFY